MNVIILEDDDNRIEKFANLFPSAQIVKTAKECIKILDREVGSREDAPIEQLVRSNKGNKSCDLLMLDHDLGGEINSSAVLMSSNLDIMLREFHLIMIGRDKMKKKTFKMTRDEVIEELMDEWWNDLEEKVAEDMIKVYLEEVGAELIVEDSKHRIDDPFWLRR
jgi:hypothetical protein